MLELYVYYQVGEAHAAALLPRVRALQAELAGAHGVATGLKKRPVAEAGLQTWMEVYTGAGAHFGAALDAAVAAAGLGSLIDGRRHTETFTEMPPCA